MPRIRVNPEQLRGAGAQLRETADHLRGLEGRLNNTLSNLEWEARRRSNLDSEVAQARQRARTLAGEADNLARLLTSAATAFEEADQQGVADLAAVTGVVAELQATWLSSEVALILGFPAAAVTAQLGLGRLLDGATPLPGSTPILLPALTPATLSADLHNLERLKTLSGLAAALVLTGQVRDGKYLISGAQDLKELAGLSPYLTRITAGNLPAHLAGEAGTDILGPALSIGAQWLDDVGRYKGEGLDKLGSALAVDAVLKGALSVGSSYAGTLVGAGVIVGAAAAIGATAPVALVAVGGIAGAYIAGQAADVAFHWLQDSGVRDTMITATTQAVDAVGSVTGSAIHDVEDTLNSAVSVVQHISWPFLP